VVNQSWNTYWRTNGKRFLAQLASTNKDANPELMRVALKLATGAGKTTVMAMLIAGNQSTPSGTLAAKIYGLFVNNHQS
jgi:hypothetical protein